MRLLMFIGIASVLATPAMAYCPRPASLFPENELQDVADYLICLHNDQVDQINALQNTVRAQAETLTDLRSTVSDLEQRVEKLERDR